MPKILKISGEVDLTYARAPILFSSFIGRVYAKRTKSMYVYEAPDLWPEELAGIKSPFLPLIMRLGKRLARASYSYSDIIITVSNLAAAHITEKYGPKSPVYGLPIGVDPNKFPRLSKDDSRSKLFEKNILPDNLRNKFIILYTGLISSAQAVGNLALVAKALKNENEIVFVIFGEGHEKSKLEQFKTEHHLDNFYLLPSQPRDLMPAIISSADLCTILLSPEFIFKIAVPTKFYEYLASGKPILGFCEGELANLINSNQIGGAVKPGDIEEFVSLIRHFRDSPEEIKKMEEKCASALQRFSLEAVGTRMREILEREI